MATKALPQAKVNTTKFLPSSKKTPVNLAKQEKEGGALLVVESKLIKVENLIKTNLKIETDSTKKKQRRQQLQQRDVSEDELEEKPEGDEKKAGKKISLPQLSFLEKIKSFLFKLVLTFVTIKLLPHLGKIVKILPSVIGFVEGVLDWSGKLFDAMAGFVAGAYELRDKTAGFMKNLGGDLLLGTFQAFEGAIGKVIEASIIIMMASGGDGGLLDVGGQMVGNWVKGRVGQQVAQQAATQLSIPGLGGAAGAGAGAGGGAGGGTATALGSNPAGWVIAAGLLSSALGEGAFQLRKMAKGPIEETKKKFDKANWLDPRKYFHGAVLAGQKLLLAPIAALGFILDIVGMPFRYAIELIRMPFLDENGQKKQAKNLAKLDSRIREDIRKGLNMLTLGFAFKEKGQFGNIYGNKGAQKEMMSTMSKMASGGTAGSRKVSRKLKRPRVQKHIMPTKLRPGSSIGDKKDFDKMFPDTKNYQKHINKQGERAWWDPAGVFTGKEKEDEKVKTGKTGSGKPMDPIGYIEEAYKTTSTAPFFGPLMGATIKLVVGDEPTKIDYMNVGKGLNAWVYSTFGDAVKEYAEGGEVTDMFLDGKDLSAAIAKSVENNTKKRANDVITELRSQLAMAPLGGGGSGSGGSGVRGGENVDSATGAGVTLGIGSGSYGEAPLIKAARANGIKGKELAAFLAQMSHESGGFRYRREISGGSSHYGGGGPWTGPDGKSHPAKFHGRGYIQLTHDYNYKKYGDMFGVDLLNNPDLAMEGELAAKIAVAYWNLSVRPTVKGDWDNVFLHSKAINNPSAAGPSNVNGYNDRVNKYNAYKKKLVNDPTGSQIVQAAQPASEDENMKDAMGSGSPSDGKKIAGELGHYMKSKRGTLPVTGSIHRHPEHPPWSKSGHSTNSLHYKGRAIDLGGWSPSSPKGGGADEQAPVLKALLAWNKRKGVKPVQLIHGSPAYKNVGSYRKHPDSHHHHVHVAYQEGGETLGGSHLATLGERGKEFVIDADSTAAMQDTFPGLLSALNKADYDDTIKVLRNYAHYELGATQNVDVPDEMITPIVIPLPSPPVPILMGGGGSTSDPFQILANGQ